MSEGRRPPRALRVTAPSSLAVVLAGALAAILASVWAAPAAAQPAADTTWYGWSAYWENDTFVPVGGSDDAFTNGVRLVFARHPNENLPLVDRLSDWFRYLPVVGRRRPYQASSALVVGNNFFTPAVITDYEPDPRDRPFAGFLYAGWRAEYTEDPDFDVLPDGTTVPKAFQDRRQHSLEVDLGVLGPWAGAEELQSGVHAAVTTHRIPKGWSGQLRNEPAASVLYMYRQKVGWPSADVVPHAGFLLGTTQTYPFAGATVRLGRNMSSFPPLVGRNTVAPTATREAWEAGVFAGVDGRYFLRNSFVEGGLLRGGPGVEPVRPVGDYRLGAFVRLLEWRFTYTFVRRSPEVAEEGPFEGLYDNYGSISFSHEPGPTEKPGRFVDCLMNGVLGMLLDDFLLELGIGPDLMSGREEGVDETHGMRIAVGRSLGGAVRDFDVAFEQVGVGRELGPPDVADGDHADRLLINRLLTLRYRPAGGRLGPGDAHVRAGVGRGWMEYEVTPGRPGRRPGPCPAGTSLLKPVEEGRYCSAEERGAGYLLGAGYAVRVGGQLGINADLSWNHIDLEETRRFLALTFGLRYTP